MLLPAVEGEAPAGACSSRAWGGIEAEISGVLGHRRHFAKYVDQRSAGELFGGLLDYCLWLDEDNKKPRHLGAGGEYRKLFRLSVEMRGAEGAAAQRGAPCLNDVYFIWEHTNFANRDAISYCLEAMQHKEDYVRRQYGDLVLVQKSSSLVEGTPALEAESVYGMLLGKTGEEISSAGRSRPPAHAMHRLAGDRIGAGAGDEKSEPAVKADGAGVVDVDVEIEAGRRHALGFGDQRRADAGAPMLRCYNDLVEIERARIDGDEADHRAAGFGDHRFRRPARARCANARATSRAARRKSSSG